MLIFSLLLMFFVDVQVVIVVIATAAAVAATATFIVVPAIAVVSVFAHFVFNAISMEISGHKLIIPVGKTRRWR
jgi:hypothetical protein